MKVRRFCVKNVKAVCFEHGCSVLDFKALCVAETGMFDVYFATDDVSMKYFKEEAPRYNKNKCRVFQEPYVFQKINELRNKGGKNAKGKVLYIPVNHSQFLRYFNNMEYPATWYYKFQKELIDFFATRSDLTFIYKQPPGHAWGIESIIAYMRRKNFKNIMIEKGPIPQYLPQVEKVILDSPSTPFFEAAAFGLPVLVIMRDYLPVWKPAMNYFGNSIQTFSRNEEALKKIDIFLSGSAKDYFINLPMQTASTYETLASIAGEKA